MGPRIFRQIVPEFYEQKSDFKKDKKKIILIFSFKKLDFLVLEERGGEEEEFINVFISRKVLLICVWCKMFTFLCRARPR